MDIQIVANVLLQLAEILAEKVCHIPKLTEKMSVDTLVFKTDHGKMEPTLESIEITKLLKL